MKLEDIISEILSEMESITGSMINIPTSDSESELLDTDEEEPVEDELDELNSTATTGDMAYATPGAFRKTDGEEDEETSGFNDGHQDPEVLGYKRAKVSRRNFESKFVKMAKEMLLKEGWWDDLSDEQQEEYLETHPNSKLAKAIKKAKETKKTKEPEETYLEDIDIPLPVVNALRVVGEDTLEGLAAYPKAELAQLEPFKDSEGIKKLNYIEDLLDEYDLEFAKK